MLTRLASAHPIRFADFTQRCLATPDSMGDTVSKATRDDDQPILPSLLGSRNSSALLREWARASLICGQWKNALTAALDVSIYLCAEFPRTPDTFGWFQVYGPENHGLSCDL